MSLPLSVVRRLIVTVAVTGVLLTGQAMPGFAGHSYEEKTDRFDGKKTATFQASLGSECKLDKTNAGRLKLCLVVFVDLGGFVYSSIHLAKTSYGWDLLGYKNDIESVPVILTYSNGVTKRRSLSADLSTQVLYGGEVSEQVNLSLSDIKDDLLRIEKIELQFGSSEYSWIPDKRLVRKALDFARN